MNKEIEFKYSSGDIVRLKAVGSTFWQKNNKPIGIVIQAYKQRVDEYCYNMYKVLVCGQPDAYYYIPEIRIMEKYC